MENAIKIIDRHQDLPYLLREIPQPPKKLYFRGDPDGKLLFSGRERHSGPAGKLSAKFLCVVGSRKNTEYGKMACEQLISGLTGQNVVIVSGLALGIDSIAHRTALDVGLKTIAVPGSGLDWNELYPKSHYQLAQEILEKGGALISPFAPQFRAAKYSFPERNRIMAGLCHATLIIEAQEKSGTLITARLATEYNRDVGTVPGSIFSENSAGPHLLIKLGATPICSTKDLLELLNINIETDVETGTETGDTWQLKKLDVQQKLFENTAGFNLGKNERMLIKILNRPLSVNELCEISKLSIREINIALSILEIMKIVTINTGVVTPNIN